MSEADKLHREQDDIIFFLNKSKGNEWFTYSKMHVYLRIGPTIYNRQMYHTLDIATVSIRDKRYRSKGIFKDFMKFLEAVMHPDIQLIHVENVITPGFDQYFIKRGWAERSFFGLKNFYNIRIDAKPMEARSEAS